MKLRELASIIGFSFALSSCNATSDIPPEEVLRRSILRSATLESASLSATLGVSIDGGSAFSGTSVIQGSLRRGGTAWNADVSFHGDGSLARGQGNSGRFTVLTSDGSRFYLKPESLRGPVENLLRPAFTGSTVWWTWGEPRSSESLRTPPTPKELQRTADFFSILTVDPPRRIVSGRLATRLHVRLKPEALEMFFPSENVAAEGMLTIDARDYTLRRAEWTIRGIKTRFGEVLLTADVAIDPYVSGPAPEEPQTPATILPLKEIFATVSP